jgi:DNA invertase Pin-like site-specific DNA recombinase
MKRKKPKNNKAIGYVRVSDVKQVDEGMSLEYQEEKIRNYCKVKDLELVKVLIDPGHSAFKHDLGVRPMGKMVVQGVESGEVCHVVALRLDRLFRSVADCSVTVRDWARAGIALHLIDLGGSTVDTSEPIGRTFLALLAAVAEIESDTKSKRMCEVWAHVKKEGRILGNTAPFGYSVGDGNKLYPNQDEQDTISLIQGFKKQGMSYRMMVKALELHQRRPRGSKWNPTTVVRILKNNPI